jgi:hypothetical protein
MGSPSLAGGAGAASTAVADAVTGGTTRRRRGTGAAGGGGAAGAGGARPPASGGPPEGDGAGAGAGRDARGSSSGSVPRRSSGSGVPPRMSAEAQLAHAVAVDPGERRSLKIFRNRGETGSPPKLRPEAERERRDHEVSQSAAEKALGPPKVTVELDPEADPNDPTQAGRMVLGISVGAVQAEFS